MKKLLNGFIFAALLLVSGTVLAPTRADAQVKPQTEEIKTFEAVGGKLAYLGKAYNLDGWLLVERDGTPRSVIYTMEDGTMLRGTLFNSAGINVTKSQMAVYKARAGGSQDAMSYEGADAKAIPKSEVFYAELEKANWIRVGKADVPYLYMLINVNCEHCQEAFRTFRGSADKGLIQLRIVPIGSEPENLKGGQALLSVDDPAAAWSQYMDGNKGALSQTLIKGDAEQRMAANNKFAAKWKQITTYPTFVYRKVSDGTLAVIAGQPENPMVVQADLMKTQ
ncbi:MAG: hypothetical protein PW788_02065 [Micavibrio sp.]|nr:hypothetical protein [Micavibrio sp.]